MLPSHMFDAACAACADVAVLTHEPKCGWRAAHVSMAQDIPRSSCCPGRQLYTIPLSRISVSSLVSCS